MAFTEGLLRDILCLKPSEQLGLVQGLAKAVLTKGKVLTLPLAYRTHILSI